MANFLLSKRIDLDRPTKSEGYVSKSPISCKLPLGYEDLNDHDELRNDPLLAVLVEKEDPDKEALAGKSTLNRLELTGETASRKDRYKKIVMDHGAVDRLLGFDLNPLFTLN